MVVVFPSASILRRESCVRKLIEVSRGAKLYFPASFRDLKIKWKIIRENIFKGISF